MPRNKVENGIWKWPFFPTTENEHYMSGKVDCYYNYKEYQKAEERNYELKCPAAELRMLNLIRRHQYIIFKDTYEMILLEDGLALKWEKEFAKGLDKMVVPHLWPPPPHNLRTTYRFANGFRIKPIGYIDWTAPDLFTWNKDDLRNQEEQNASPLRTNTTTPKQPQLSQSAT